MMEREERRVLSLDQYQHGVIVNALNDKRNDLIKEKRPTDIVDEVLLKALDAPRKKVRCTPDLDRGESGRGSRPSGRTSG